jgi:putative redox protein
MTDAKPDVAAELIWSGDLRFGATSGAHAIVIDGHGTDGPNPVQLLVFGLAGCMGIDVADILLKGRHPLVALRVSLSGQRAVSPPRRLLAVSLTFHVQGNVPPAAVERAVGLSRDKYCSVWHSLRQDIELTTRVELFQ